MAEPYYRDELVTLYHGDCLEVIEWLGADVLVTDPPYGTGQNGYGRAEIRTVAKTIANDLDTATRDAALDKWGDRPALVFASPRLPAAGTWSDVLVWDKGQRGMNGGPWRYQHESVYVRGFERRSDGDPSILKAFDQRAGGAYRPHPHFKPVALMEHLVERAPAGTVADPFAGSGSTVVACRNLGRPVIAVEVEEEFCELIVSRLGQQAFDFAEVRSSGWSAIPTSIHSRNEGADHG